MAEGKVVFVRVGAIVADGTDRVWVCVGGNLVWVGKGVCVAGLTVGTEVGEDVCDTTIETGVAAEPDRGRVPAGVGRKTPGTTGSVPSTCPSSRRMISSTAGFMGATSS